MCVNESQIPIYETPFSNDLCLEICLSQIKKITGIKPGPARQPKWGDSRCIWYELGSNLRVLPIPPTPWHVQPYAFSCLALQQAAEMQRPTRYQLNSSLLLPSTRSMFTGTTYHDSPEHLYEDNSNTSPVRFMDTAHHIDVLMAAYAIGSTDVVAYSSRSSKLVIYLIHSVLNMTGKKDAELRIHVRYVRNLSVRKR